MDKNAKLKLLELFKRATQRVSISELPSIIAKFRYNTQSVHWRHFCYPLKGLTIGELFYARWLIITRGYPQGKANPRELKNYEPVDSLTTDTIVGLLSAWTGIPYDEIDNALMRSDLPLPVIQLMRRTIDLWPVPTEHTQEEQRGDE